MSTRLTALIFFVIAGCAAPSAAHRAQRQPQPFGPWSSSVQAPVVHSSLHPGSAATREDGFVDFAFSIYSKYITRIDGARCEHRPTCSRYAVEAIKTHGYVLGTLFTIDRLVRGSRSSTLRQLPVYKVEDGHHYFHDPLQENDFFL